MKLLKVLFTHYINAVEISCNIFIISKGIKITATALEPGVVRTELGRHLFSKLDITSIAYGVLLYLVLPFSKSANQGAQTQIRLARLVLLVRLAEKVGDG